MKTNFFEKYLAGVRWLELLLVAAVAALTSLQLTVQRGGKINQEATIEALLAGLGAALVYLRVPKAEDPSPTSVPDGSLPPGVDATGPAHDVEPSAVEQVVASVLPPALTAVVPDLAGDITRELGRVLRRGIRW